MGSVVKHMLRMHDMRLLAPKYNVVMELSEKGWKH